MKRLVLALLLCACTETTHSRRPDGGWCYWATDIIKTEAQCDCVFSCYGCCDVRGQCWPLSDGQTTCPSQSVAGIFRL